MPTRNTPVIDGSGGDVKRSEPIRVGSTDWARSASGHCLDPLRRPSTCVHDAPLQCSACGALMLGAELCPDPAAHTRRLGAGLIQPQQAPARTYNTDWPRDGDGYALVTFTNRHTGKSVTISCFSPYLDPETHVTLLLCPCQPKLPGDTIEIISGLSPDQFKERAAHLPGRDRTEHERVYFTTVFFRDYYFAGAHKDIKQHQTRSWRRRRIQRGHARANCTSRSCRKRHDRPLTTDN
jgi:hypothetical protein